MKLLERAKGIRKSPKNIEFETEEVKEYDIDLENNGWNELTQNPPQHLEAPQREREVSHKDSALKRKVLGAMATSINGRIDVNILNQRDVKIDANTRGAIIDKMASGRIGPREERSIIERVPWPMQNPENAINVVNSLNTKQEKRILASFGTTGFDNWESVNAGDMRKFVRDYPTPMDFQTTSEQFLDAVEQNNGLKKRAVYEAAMESFKQKVYGRRYEYWKTMQEINDEVVSARRAHESERSAEWRPGSMGVCQTSRDQARANLVKRRGLEYGLRANDTCEDTFFSNGKQQLYAVFDGAGGIKGGRLAAKICEKILRKASEDNDYSKLEDVLKKVNNEVGKDPDAGIATATVAYVKRDGDKTKLVYASVGDSRLYIVDRSGNARLMTHDECFYGNQLTNYVGNTSPEYPFRVDQLYEVELQRGDRIVLCTDGITGDRGDELMSEQELGSIVHNSHGANDAAINLVAASRKVDDRTALVFTPDFDRK